MNTIPLAARRQELMRKARAPVPEVPKEYWSVIKGKAARDVWRAFCSARTNFLPHELLILGRIVSLELQIRELDAKINTEGYLVPGPRGDLVPSPYYNLKEKLVRLQMTIMRSVNLVTNTSSAQAEARAVHEARSVQDSLKDSLLAR